MSAMYGAQHVRPFPKALRNGSMTDFENKIDHAIATWYLTQFSLRNLIVEAFDYRPWDQLYDEQKKIASQLYWREVLS